MSSSFNATYSFFKAHDVFVSFRGDDTRTNFTSHLYNALNQKSIRTYIDDKLEKGEDVWPALARAIEQSDVAIVVFSENYASSKWCLEELLKILECRKKHGQIVIPVFYEVDPSDIRKQTGSYEKGFAKHERDLTEEVIKQKVLRWRKALTEAANISGWDSRIHKDESTVIKNVVNDVLQKLHLKYPTELKGLVQAENNCENVELLMKKHRVIGIWGMGGIGKSTIAKALFAKHFPQYDHVCFVANAKEYSLSKLFSELLKEEVYTSNVVGSTLDMRRLSSKKVFIVLDNVDMDSLDPFECLYREYDVLDRDSRLIITTRNKQLLVGRVDVIHEVKEWKNPESLELFCKEAFKQSSAPKNYKSLSQSAVTYAQGVPLALKVLGSYFRSKRNIKFWESTLDKLNTYPNKQIQNVLEVSYAGLDDLEKNIFLDIAFFFKEKEVDHVIGILDACGLKAASGIEVLEDQALITILKSNIFPRRRKQIQMHDLLQQMGLEIVRQECSTDPGKRSRLKGKEACEVIEKNKGTDAIQGIALDLSQIKDLPLPADTFTKMKSLRFLKLYNTLGQSSSNIYLDLPASLETFSDELRYIEWIGYPFESLPSPFCAKFLVEIRMPQSKVKNLWNGIQELDNLEGIELSECRQFEELPDLSRAPRLKWVNLTCCESLQYLTRSVLSSDTLETLILDGCTNLKRVKGEKHLKSLKKISVNGCLSLEEYELSSDLIENLDLSNTGIQTLNASFGSMRNLKQLNLEGLKLRHPLKELSCSTSLMELRLSDSGIVIDEQQLHVMFDGLRSLLKLHMKDLSNLSELPENISVLSKLQELRLDGSNVKRLPESIQNLVNLGILSLENCKELQCLPTLPSRIKYLIAINCSSLVSVSSLNPLATEMLGMIKTITFKNSLKLDGLSCKLIMKSLQLTMMHAIFDNVRSRHFALHGYNYTSVVLCLPGSRVPWHIKYRSTKSSIFVELPKHPNLLGLIYSVVLSPADGMKKLGTRIKSKCYLPKDGVKEAWLNSDIGEMKSDHVYIWYDPYHCDRILQKYEQKVCFEFSVANEEGEVDASVYIKECGIRLVSVSDVPVVLEELDLDWFRAHDLVRLVEFVQGKPFTDGEVDSDSDKVEPESDEANESKNHYSDVDENIKSIHQETKTDSDSGTDCKQNTKESTNMVKYEGNEEMPTKPDAILHETDSDSDKVEPESDEDNESKNHYSDVDENIKSSDKATKTDSDSGTDCKQNTKESTNTVKSKGNKRMPAEPDASLHDPIDSQQNTEYYESDEKSNTHSKLVVMVELESAKEDNRSNDYFSGVKESIESTHKEIQQTTDRRGPKKKSTKSKEVAKSRGNERILSESNGLHLPMVSFNEENAFKDKSREINSNNIEEARQSEENETLQGGENIIVDSDIIDLNIVEEPNHEKENKGMDIYCKAEGEDGSDLDPFSELDSILFTNLKSSAKATSSTTDIDVREALHNLHCLLENSLESILGDTELQQQLHIDLKCIEEASYEKVSPNVAKLVEGMASSIDDLFKEFALTQKVVEDHTSHLQQKEKLVQQVRDAKKQLELVNKEISQCKFGTERLDKDDEKLDEKIRCFVEQKKSVTLKKVKLKETLERCEGEKKKLKHEAKIKVSESKELMLAIEKSKALYDAALSKQQKLNNKWQGFRIAFADNCGTLVPHNSLWHQPELLVFLFFIINIILCYEGSEKHPHSG